jgi:hypothetical protein
MADRVYYDDGGGVGDKQWVRALCFALLPFCIVDCAGTGLLRP